MREEERKLAVAPTFELPELASPDTGVADVVAGPRLVLRATYYDTEDLRLARNSMTLRHRTGQGSPTWHLKLPVAGEDASVREELAVRGAAGRIPDTLRELVTAWVRGGELVAVSTLRTRRQVYALCNEEGTELAELVDDTVSVLDGRRVSSTFRELEVERRADDGNLLERVAARLVAAGAVEDGFVPKVVRALGPRAVEPGDLPQPPGVSRRSRAGDVVTLSLVSGTRRLVSSDVGVRRSSDDAVHQMRVACRRMRSDLRTFAPLVEPEWAEQARTELKWLADVLGGPRDLEVLRARLQETADRDRLAPLDPDAVAAIDAVLVAREEVALAELREALASPRYLALVEFLLTAATAPPLTPAAQDSAATALPPLVGKTWDALSRKADKLTPEADDESWHRVRILGKRARYAAEAVAPALGKPAARLGKAVAAVQEVLGEHQDAAIAADTVLALGQELDPSSAALDVAVTCGRLAERERAAVRTARSAFPPVWDRATNKKNLGWLSD